MASLVCAGLEAEVAAGKLLKKRKYEEIYGEGKERVMVEGIVLRPGEGRKWVVFWDIPRPGGLESEHGANFWTVKQQGASDTQNLAVNDESDGMRVETAVELGDDEVPDDDVDHDPAQAAGPTDVQDHYLTTNGMSCKVEQNLLWIDQIHHDGAPHMTRIARKPGNVAIEVQTADCDETEFCLCAEIGDVQIWEMLLSVQKETSVCMLKWEMCRRYDKRTRWIRIAQMYVADAGATDRYNCTRQDGFRLERNIESKNWVNRVIISFLGFFGANAYKAAKFGGYEGNQTDFMEELAHQPITNEFEGLRYVQAKKDAEKRNSNQNSFGDSEVPEATAVHASCFETTGMKLKHMIRPLATHESLQDTRGPKGYCSICRNSNASFFCVSCTQKKKGKFVYLCSSKSQRDFMAWHCQLCSE